MISEHERSSNRPSKRSRLDLSRANIVEIVALCVSHTVASGIKF